MRFNNKVFSIVLVMLISVLATACSSSTVTTEIFSFTPEEEKDLITKASDYLTTQNTKHFAPTCVREHSYRYDSYDTKYGTLKYTRPIECKECPLARDSLCQKVYKKKVTDDLRRYTVPARGSMKWTEIYKERSAVERVNAYLKGYFLLNQIYHCTGKKAKVHFDLVHLAYNACKLAVDRLSQLQLSVA